ncbi:MAG: FecR domain-containing protein [Treponema sp.]|jgi:hypothetical protein|nr:FecR domain-containing protein [Treponema sp.]
MKKTVKNCMKLWGLLLIQPCFLAAQQPGHWFFAEKALIRDIRGTVEIKSPGNTAWEPAVAGQELEQKTIVSTGFKSTAIISLGASSIMVRPLTRLTVEEIVRSQEADQVSLFLQTGRVRASVNPPTGGRVNFTVRSPTVTASVRGTVFDFDTINLRVGAGNVYFIGAGGTAMQVTEGRTAHAGAAAGQTALPTETGTGGLMPPAPVGTGMINSEHSENPVSPGGAPNPGGLGTINLHW